MLKIASKILKILIAIAILALVGLLFIKIFSHPITPVTPQQMYDALSARGYKTQYAMQLVSDNLKKLGLIDCVVAEKNDIHVDFYSFDNDDAAQAVNNKAVSLIHAERRDPPTRDYNEGNSNHWRYTLIGKTMYSTAIYVGNTAIYAYSDTDNAAEINALLESIGYTKMEGSGQLSAKLSPLFQLLFTLGWLPLTLICQHWLWPVVYHSSGTTQIEIDKFCSKSSKRLSRHKIIAWLIEKSIRPRHTVVWAVIYQLALLPELIAILLSFVGLFTSIFDEFFSVYIFVVVGITFATAIIGSILDKILYRTI